MIDPLGLMVQLCEREVDIGLPKGISGIIPKHHWIKTDTAEVGMGGECPIPGQGCADLPGVKVYTKDHTGQSSQPNASCKAIENIDEACVNEKIKPGKYLGRWHPLNQCQTFAQSVINQCSKSNGPYIEHKKPW